MTNKEKFLHEAREAQVLGMVGGAGGDESKGLWTARVMDGFDAVARWGGGQNAGHSYGDFSLHLIPMGAVKGIPGYIGQGCLVNAVGAIQELAGINARFGIMPQLRIDRNCPLWTPYHRYLEIYIEKIKDTNATGSTGQAIGPMAALDLLRTSVRTGMLLRPDLLRDGIEESYDILQPIFFQMQDLKWLGEVEHPEKVWTTLLHESSALHPFITDVGFELRELLKNGKRIVAEGHQGTMLDPKFGTWPFVTATPCTAHSISYGLGLPPNIRQQVLLVTKTMPTRVGAGPFPSEIWDRESAKNFPTLHPELFRDGEPRTTFLESIRRKMNAEMSTDAATAAEISQYFQVLAKEFGRTTGRGRSVGYFDVPWHRYSIIINDAKWVALSLLDVLSGLKRIRYVKEYWVDGKRLKDGEVPASWTSKLQAYAADIDWDCWPENIYSCNSWGELPDGAKKYVERLQEALGTPILATSTGPEEDSWMMVNIG
ncbi:MAG: hypothetical protein A2751_05675 [Candidatus Doudnabacteria bacterium RIFCSPHIGHO2_01_FULL_46_14]|uniref:Adenylosuccinate synthetase n=1 Tax=Candidatus Doudnabacteria bacterium RIFCSPHIGHO2_01_FULL_46_14 TaxID=1817824 RepID=A0A1F5NNK3_9BACT|nr:MAG: hypothetical protein A2751_05675 [Candidatus Doudnabacteria bacterium RIFCSPHIGHO2_01_FULL_46_14]